MLDTDDLNMLPKNLIPEEPPGIEPIIIQRRATTCMTAHTMVHGVLCKCNAQYSVAISVNPYSEVVRALSLLNIDLRWFQGP